MRSTWNVAYDAAWVLPADSTGAPDWTTFTEPLLDRWPMFIILVLLFTMAFRKKDGLWSTQPSWTERNVQTKYVPAGYETGYELEQPESTRLAKYQHCPESQVAIHSNKESEQEDRNDQTQTDARLHELEDGL
jgi:hypothetical protein